MPSLEDSIDGDGIESRAIGEPNGSFFKYLK